MHVKNLIIQGAVSFSCFAIFYLSGVDLIKISEILSSCLIFEPVFGEKLLKHKPT